MRTKFLHIAGLIALGVSSRLLPHPPNMTMIGAIALKSRSRFGPIGIVIPVISMLASDIVIGFYDWRLLLSVYTSFALFGMLGVALRQKRSVVATGVIAALGSTLFFLTTNSIVWALSSWYPHTIVGLFACLIAGLPFYGTMLIGDVLATLALYKLPSAFAARVPRTLRRNLDKHFLRPALE